MSLLTLLDSGIKRRKISRKITVIHRVDFTYLIMSYSSTLKLGKTIWNYFYHVLIPFSLFSLFTILCFHNHENNLSFYIENLGRYFFKNEVFGLSDTLLLNHFNLNFLCHWWFWPMLRMEHVGPGVSCSLKLKWQLILSLFLTYWIPKDCYSLVSQSVNGLGYFCENFLQLLTL